MSQKPLKVGDELSVKERNKKLDNEQVSLDLALRDIMGTPLGRTWIWDLLGKCHTFSTTKKSTDRDTMHAIGEQNIGLQVLVQIHKVCPGLYSKAMEEEANKNV